MIRGGPVTDTFQEFLDHAEECERCDGTRLGLVRATGVRPKAELRRLYGTACEAGEKLLWEWDTEVQNRVRAPESSWVARRLGIWHEWPGREERVRALLDVPQLEFLAILRVEDDRAREAEIEAIVRAWRRRHQAPKREAPNSEVCSICGNPMTPKQIREGRDSHYACWRRSGGRIRLMEEDE